MIGDKHLHIVSFTVPYPVAHGGLYDLYYKLQALYKAGVNIHLHCFGSTIQPGLNRYCASVYYYKREKSFSLSIPYIVYSRRSAELRNRLLKDDFPILLEGIHSTYLLNDSRFSGRNIILRLHNVEYLYYKRLFHSSHSFLRKIYYLYESFLLKGYEYKIVNRPSVIFTVSEDDKERYEAEFAAHNTEFLPVFIDNMPLSVPPGTGCFCLYHGNLSVAENERAVLWLLDKVFNDLNIPLVIAGRQPSRFLRKKIQRSDHATLIADPSASQLEDVIRKAQCHVLPSFNSTGVKLKLVNALYGGRHCIVNNAAVSGSRLEELCSVGRSASDFQRLITELFVKPVSSEDIRFREQVLNTVFDNANNAEKIIRRL